MDAGDSNVRRIRDVSWGLRIGPQKVVREVVFEGCYLKNGLRYCDFDCCSTGNGQYLWEWSSAREEKALDVDEDQSDGFVPGKGDGRIHCRLQ